MGINVLIIEVKLFLFINIFYFLPNILVVYFSIKEIILKNI